MNVLLIAPPLFLEDKRKIFPRFPPYLMLSAAGSLEYAGFKVRAYDAYLEGANLERIKDLVEESHPSLIGLCPADMTRFPPIEIDIALINFLKQRFPGIPLCVFGIGKEDLINTILIAAPEVDYVLLGDPEESIVELARNIENGVSCDGVKGLMVKRSRGDFAVIGSPRLIDNLDRLNFPAWHLIDLNRYYFFPHRYKTSRAYPISTARGCPWNRCVFCKEVSVYGSSVYRSRSAQSVVSEIEYVVKQNGCTEIQFFDANFNTDLEWLKIFYQEIRKKGLSFHWLCLARVDKISKEALELMRLAGCWNICFGIESSSTLLLETIDKGITVEQIKKAIMWANESGIEVTGSFLVGLPNERPVDVINTARFAVMSGISYAQFFIAKWNQDHQEFSSLGTLTSEWDYSQFDFRGRVFIPRAYRNIKHLKSVQRKAYLFFYFHPRTIFRHIKKINSLAEVKRLFLALFTLIRINTEKPNF